MKSFGYVINDTLAVRLQPDSLLQRPYYIELTVESKPYGLRLIERRKVWRDFVKFLSG